MRDNVEALFEKRPTLRPGTAVQTLYHWQEHTFPVDFHFCDGAKVAKVLPQLSICHILGNIANIHIAVVGVSSVYS